MFPFSKSNGAPDQAPETPQTDPAAPQNPPRADRAATVHSRAEVHADAILRGRTEFDRHHVRAALISAFISGADLVAGESTEQPAPPKPADERPQLTEAELAERDETERAQEHSE